MTELRTQRCSLCGDFHFATDGLGICDDCIRCLHGIRNLVEARGGSVVVVGDSIRVRTARERENPYVVLEEMAETHQAIAETRKDMKR